MGRLQSHKANTWYLNNRSNLQGIGANRMILVEGIMTREEVGKTRPLSLITDSCSNSKTLSTAPRWRATPCTTSNTCLLLPLAWLRRTWVQSITTRPITVPPKLTTPLYQTRITPILAPMQACNSSPRDQTSPGSRGPSKSSPRAYIRCTIKIGQTTTCSRNSYPKLRESALQ
jgi:hypothetical protein